MFNSNENAHQTMIVISSSYGNDSIALIQWAFENALNDVVVTFIDTGWAGAGWLNRVDKCETWVKSLGFRPVRIGVEVPFRELMIIKKGFPNQRFQWCSSLLKGIPFLNWIDHTDINNEAFILVGKRREESTKRASTPAMVISDYHGGRILMHPLYKHTDAMRNKLLHNAGFEVLAHRSQECAPCVNANTHDFRTLHAEDIEKVEALEHLVNKTMFRPKRHNGAQGIREVVKWASYGSGKYNPDQDDLFTSGCGSPFGCGL